VDTNSTEIAAARVARGVALLDERVPDWRAHIDLELLDMGNSSRCVLGQLAAALGGVDDVDEDGAYEYGRTLVDLPGAGETQEHGFDRYWVEDITYLDLRDLWVAAING
jgi:hypothetical protein